MSSKEPEKPCQQRLHRVLASSGVGSRRKCEQLIREGLVSVDGEVVTDVSFKLCPSTASIRLRGKQIRHVPKPVCFLVNKPKGVLSTCSDPQGRPTILGLVPRCSERLFPVGRLDWDSQGLILLTNDGEIAQVLAHPRYQVEKEYLVKVRGIPADDTLKRALKGVRLEDGRARVKAVELVSKTSRNAWLRVVVCEGRKRFLKRMFQALGHPVAKLKRIRLFYLRLGNIKEGAAVAMTQDQMDMLKRRCEKLRRSVDKLIEQQDSAV